MTAFPNCRVDYFYNEDFLNKAQKLFLDGYDAAIEEAELFFDNLGSGEFDEVHLRQLEDMKDMLLESFKDWVEFDRDKMITSMIESLSHKEFRENRCRVLEENAKKPKREQKKYYDTGRFSTDSSIAYTGPDEECYDTSEDEEGENNVQ